MSQSLLPKEQKSPLEHCRSDTRGRDGTRNVCPPANQGALSGCPPPPSPYGGPRVRRRNGGPHLPGTSALCACDERTLRPSQELETLSSHRSHACSPPPSRSAQLSVYICRPRERELRASAWPTLHCVHQLSPAQQERARSHHCRLTRDDLCVQRAPRLPPAGGRVGLEGVGQPVPGRGCMCRASGMPAWTWRLSHGDGGEWDFSFHFKSLKFSI